MATVDVGFIFPHPTPPPSPSSPQLEPNLGISPMQAPPLSRGMWASASILAVDGGIWVGGTAGTQEWEAHQVHHSNEPPQKSWLVFSLPLTLSPTTSLAYKSMTEVAFYEASTPFAPPA